MSESHQVFISYSHDSSAHEQAVLTFANRLRDDGIAAWLDQYEVVADSVRTPRVLTGA
jgi:hypothetical protein